MKWIIVFTIFAFFGSQCFGEVLNIPDDFETIQDGINAAEDGDTVLVAPGEYIENIDYLSKSITVASHFLTTGNEEFIEQTIIDGDQETCVVLVECEIDREIEPVITGFTIRNGRGGIGAKERNEGDINILISQNIIEHNLSMNMAPRGSGSAIAVIGCSASIRNNVIRFNEAEGHGAGIYVFSSEECVIEGNEINDNNALGRGGGIHIRECENDFISMNIIYSNTGSRGGGISIFESYPLIANNTICFNSTNHEWENEAGGGIYSDNENPLPILNSIIFGNQSARGAQVFTPNAELIARFCDIQEDIEGDGNLNVDPMFVDSENGDFNLSGDSPCIDAGTAFFVYEEDTLIDISEENYIGNAPDMGALEFDPAEVMYNEGNIPSLFALNSCHPNPFNSSTKISYILPTISPVSLSVFDVKGRLVETIFDGNSHAGMNSTIWNAEGFPPGLYFVRLSDGVNTESCKVVLVK